MFRFFEDAKYAELKLKFYGYMIELGQHEGDYLDICKNFRHVHDTPVIQEVRFFLLQKEDSFTICC